MQDIEVTAEPGSGKVQLLAHVGYSGLVHNATHERNPDQARALAREILAAADIAEQAAASPQPPMGVNAGHGHVWLRPDGMKARCGGPAICPDCARDKAQHDS